MKKFEHDLAVELDANEEKYIRKAGGEAEFISWCKTSLGHLPNHVALTWIRAYAIEHMFSIRSMPTFPSLPATNIIFDMLHGKQICFVFVSKPVCNHPGAGTDIVLCVSVNAQACSTVSMTSSWACSGTSVSPTRT